MSNTVDSGKPFGNLFSRLGGKAARVHDIDSARFGIEQIVRQGEGSVPETQPMIPDSPRGACNHYGQPRRTYG
ncbi:hypothetical protein [Burkholderia ubonensis]|uniref:Uncharacterized protein n=1 Tax=Burkholderia ubonensis subsp. mesacidophila TaxID=265293 RepID=A0A2A4FLD4_9BURK|nr:hypothetical protein [Burkholderia ubonensis]PCE33159.1 hypothetical protein BZL54_07365 [Burkholderia ubonensis subsp. mesacidophila]